MPEFPRLMSIELIVSLLRLKASILFSFLYTRQNESSNFFHKTLSGLPYFLRTDSLFIPAVTPRAVFIESDVMTIFEIPVCLI